MTDVGDRSVDEYLASLDEQTAEDSALLAQLERHSTTGYCVYIKRLSDVDLTVLERIVRASYEFVESKAQEGPIREILWKSAT